MKTKVNNITWTILLKAEEAAEATERRRGCGGVRLLLLLLLSVLMHVLCLLLVPAEGAVQEATQSLYIFGATHGILHLVHLVHLSHVVLLTGWVRYPLGNGGGETWVVGLCCHSWGHVVPHLVHVRTGDAVLCLHVQTHLVGLHLASLLHLGLVRVCFVLRPQLVVHVLAVLGLMSVLHGRIMHVAHLCVGLVHGGGVDVVVHL